MKNVPCSEKKIIFPYVSLESNQTGKADGMTTNKLELVYLVLTF